MTSLNETQQSKPEEKHDESQLPPIVPSENDPEKLVARRKRRKRPAPTEGVKLVDKLHFLVEKAYDKELNHIDDNDISLQPSFCDFQVPYYIKCRNRYNAKKRLYEQRFQYEIEQLTAQQPTGYEAARLTRHLCISTLWPPLHNISEIVHTQRNFFRLKDKERSRLNWIMATNII